MTRQRLRHHHLTVRGRFCSVVVRLDTRVERLGLESRMRPGSGHRKAAVSLDVV